MMMRAVVLDKPGRPSTLYMDNISLPEPGEGEVRIRVHAVSLNPVDYKLAASGHPAWRYPFVLGLDVAGTVDGLGVDVTGWQIGDRAFYHGNLSRPGGFAEYVVTVAHVLARIPDDVSYVAAAAVPCAGLTAYQALKRRLCVRAGQTVLVQGGAGGVGGFGVQLATEAGATVITTASEHNFEYVRSLGADYVIDYRHEDVHARVMELTDGCGVDGLVDTVSSENATRGTRMLAFGGGLTAVAGLPDFSLVNFDKAISIHAIALGGAYFDGGREAQAELGQMGEEMISMVAAGKIDPMVGEVIGLEEAPAGLERLAGRHVRGKIVVEVLGEEGENW